VSRARKFISTHLPALKPLLRHVINWFAISPEDPYIKMFKGYFTGKVGLEIGGPSFLWAKIIPVYKWARRVDNHDFSEDYIRHHRGTGKNKFRYFMHKSGDQYCGEKAYEGFQEESYDFVILRDVLEHTANPLKMLKHLCRITKTGGAIIVVTPNKAATYDYARPYTSFKHILEDFVKDTQEDDSTHFQEFRDLYHDTVNPDLKSREELNEMIESNFEHRRLHHHVFSLDVLSRCCSEAGFRVVYATQGLFPHTIVIATKYDRQWLRMKPSVEKILMHESSC